MIPTYLVTTPVSGATGDNTPPRDKEIKQLSVSIDSVVNTAGRLSKDRFFMREFITDEQDSVIQQIIYFNYDSVRIIQCSFDTLEETYAALDSATYKARVQRIIEIENGVSRICDQAERALRNAMRVYMIRQELYKSTRSI